MFVLATRTICFQKICTYPLLSEQTSHSQQSMLMAYKSHPVPTLYYADGTSHILSLCSIVLIAHESHPVPELRYADGIPVTSCPYNL